MMTDSEWETMLQTVRDLAAAKARLEAENADLRAKLAARKVEPSKGR